MRSFEQGGSDVSFKDILARQGLNEDLGPDDVTLIQVSHKSYKPSDQEKTWYAVPKQITAYNPLSNSKENGTLHEDGSFVAERAYVDTKSKLQRRSMIFGKSMIKSSNIGIGTVINDATVETAHIGEYVTVDEKSTIRGLNDPTLPNMNIGNNTIIGKNVYLASTLVGSDVSMGDYTMVTRSNIHDSVITDPSSPRDEQDAADNQKTKHETHIFNSTIGVKAIIGAFSQISNSSISRFSRIGERVYIDSATLNGVDKRYEGIGLHIPDGSVLQSFDQNLQHLRKSRVRSFIGKWKK